MSPSARRFVHASRVCVRVCLCLNLIHADTTTSAGPVLHNKRLEKRNVERTRARRTTRGQHAKFADKDVCVCACAMPDGGLSVSRSRITTNKSASNLQRNQLAERQQRWEHTRNQVDATQHHNTNCGILEEMRPGSDLSARVYAHIITACVTDRKKNRHTHPDSHTPLTHFVGPRRRRGVGAAFLRFPPQLSYLIECARTASARKHTHVCVFVCTHLCRSVCRCAPASHHLFGFAHAL